MISVISCIKRKRKLFLSLFLLVIILVVLFFNITKIIPNSIAIRSNTGNILTLNGEFYYCNNGKIINCDNSTILYDANQNIIAAASDKYIYALEENTKILKIDKNGKLICVIDAPSDFEYNQNFQIFFIDNILYIFNNDNKSNSLYMFDANLKILNLDDLKKGSKNYIIQDQDYFIIENKTHYLITTEYNNKNNVYAVIKKDDGDCIFSNCDIKGLYNNNLIFMTSQYTLKLFKYNLTSNKILESDFLGSDAIYTKSIKNYKNELITQGMISNKGNVEYSDQLYYHYKDIIMIVNAESFIQKNIYKTKTYERIIFCNQNTVMTYYKGHYLTYDLNNWKIIRKQDADEIKNGGSYTFETCGDYIFVFDDDSGELLNTININ